jgi:prepilin-type N-terminal cleavage/methylation domain-containing protein
MHVRISCAARGMPHFPNGFTLMEFLVVVTLIVVLATVALPAFSDYYEGCCVKAAVVEIAGMIKEAKQNALCAGKDYAIGFDTGSGKVSLISGKGHDNKWNTADDEVVRFFRLMDKGGGLTFGYGGYGPLPGLAAASDGVTFQSNNTLVCNGDLTGNAGTVYIISRRGRAMAIVMNSTDFGYALWRWNGKKWVKV